MRLSSLAEHVFDGPALQRILSLAGIIHHSREDEFQRSYRRHQTGLRTLDTILIQFEGVGG